MSARTIASIVIALSWPIAAHAQHASPPSQGVARAPREASQYDFLVGQWSLTVTPKASTLAQRIHGVRKLGGTWSAWRALDGWGIEDELRIVDASGNPQTFVHFTRFYDPRARHWNVSGIDVYRQQLTQSVAELQGDAMTALADGTDGDGKAYRSRTRLTRIAADAFRYQQDRSYDGGRTWDEGLVVIDAKRVSATAPR
ncbi:MAG: hypothetical protein JO180_09100 [Gemmatirosa sp.]|nr:hypothetical protein [Gemmatirosa sp.]